MSYSTRRGRLCRTARLRFSTALPGLALVFIGVGAGALLSGLESGCTPLDTASRNEAEVVSGSFGGKSYRLFVPSGYHAGTKAPLVVMLHGCTQSASVFEQATHMDTVAESETFFVLYPEQPSSANPQECWLWYDPPSQVRGGGDAGFFASLIANLRGSYDFDADRTFVAGFSAGGAMVPVLSATYPDLYAAVAVNSGLEFKAATSTISALTAMSTSGPDPATQGRAAYKAMGTYARVVPTIVFHGSADYTVNPKNGDQALSQAATTNDIADNGSEDHSISDTPAATQTGTVPGGRSFTHTLYNDHSGQVVMEKYIVTGMSHAWSGGSTSSYGDPNGPDASALIWAFFKAHPKNGAPPPPPVDMGAIDGGHAPSDMTAPHDAGPDMTPGDGGSSQSFTSIGSEDGFAGQFFIDGASAAVHKVGDKGLFNTDTYRLILSFDTSKLPAGATIRGARLRIVRHSLTGSVSKLTLSVKSGAFGSAATLAQEDYGALATQSGLATATPPAADGQAVEFTLPASAFSTINRTGRTQFRIAATTPLGFASNQLTIYGGEEGVSAPTLTLDY